MLHWVDLSIIAIIGLSIITGMFRGFVKELVALCIWALAVWLAYSNSASLDPFLEKYIHDQTARTIAGFVLIMIAVLVVGGIFNAILGFILKKSGLSGTDRILGMGFGFVRGVFLVALVMVVIKMTSLPHEAYSRESALYARFDPAVAWLYSYIPDFIKQVEVFDKQLDHRVVGADKTSMLDLSAELDLSDS